MLISHKKQSRKSYGYLTGPEGDSVVELHSVLLLPIIQPFPADADCHRSQIVIEPKIVLMLWGGQARNV